MARPRGGGSEPDGLARLLGQLEEAVRDVERLRADVVTDAVGASETRLRLENLGRLVEDLKQAVFGDRGSDPLTRRVAELERAYTAHEAERVESTKGRWAAVAAFVVGFFSLLCSLASWWFRKP